MMNCEEFRDALIERPAVDADAFAAHEAACPACAAYAARVRTTEARLEQALRFDVDGLKQQHAAAAARVAPVAADPRRGRWLAALGGAVAGIAATLTVWFVVSPGRELPPARLAAAVVEHWYHEPDAWIETTAPVADAVLVSALEGKAVLDVDAIGPVTYAHSCYVAGQWVPHLIVQGEAGPFMVLLMPERALSSPVPLSLEAEALDGAVFPAGGGSIAVLGGDAAESEAVGRAVAAAVEWTI